MRISETARINKIAILCHGVVDGIIVAAYLMEVIKGSRTWSYFALLTAIAVLPVLVEIGMFAKNRDSLFIKKVMAWCYALLYAFAIFTTNSILPFTYIIPMLVVITLYSDQKYCLKIGIGAFLINLADVIYKAKTVGITKEELPDIEIRLFLVLLVCIFVFLSTRVVSQINKDKRKELEEEKSKIEKLLQEIMRLSGELSQGVEQVSEHMNRLESSTNEMGSAMEDVNAGTQETAESVQNQLIRTEEIQKLIDNVRKVSGHIKESMETASREVDNGMTNMNELSEQAGKSRQANATVERLMDKLRTQAEKMDEIIAMITGVANRTGMLALNASIEAARAGDAGKGFAVVATQVTELSEQTKTAAVNITELIRAVVEELREVTEAVAILTENTNAQGEKAKELGEILGLITSLTNGISEKTQAMESMISNLAEANGDIVQNIQTISAVTEEVTAHSSETMNACRENRKIVNEVSEIAAKLSGSAKELKSAQEQ